MAAIAGGVELLRLDRGTWARYARTGSIASAAFVAMGAYAVFAFDRFGFLAVLEPRPSIRMLLVGFYGWLGLAGAAWALGRFVFHIDTPFEVVFQLFGFAHLPLLVVAVTAQFMAVLLQILGPAFAIAVFTVVFWMPALLVGASRQVFDIETRRAILLVGGPYVVWLLVVGRLLHDQLGHLL